ncbi:flagellar basal body P-ring protein FlgI [Paremcibacter congregatus]|uniref:Flagellar P-ring protein n=1 Tax=Paremcibacter congregatus TaxID=2043170 RepID=A0A2G4YLY0_9PROT|nr:flagellar basal body P-ring protein FlgI [Paremcibacter congregatus]PHZ83335.1 flagellar biosynthesis protein FlgA [Paremcibacter congregatus]QDE28192.1 flagellar basal body P-ring protein FlgI [Paremcibacter congregatus]
MRQKSLIQSRLKKYVTLLLITLISLGNGLSAQAASRIKDLVSIEGIRDNQLVGYGLVVGLNGTGDSLRNAPFTEQSIVAMLERLGVNTRGAEMKAENVAAVMVTASLSPFARPGNRLDINVSSIGDADNLRGGTLIVTPLKGADGEVYAVAQGSIQVSGFSAGGDAGSITQGVPTAGRIPNGGIVEKEVNYSMLTKKELHLSLRTPDFTTSRRIANVINKEMGTKTAMALDPSTVLIIKPEAYNNTMVDLVTDLEQLYVQPDRKAKVVVDERSGIIVIGNEVRVSEVAIAQGNLTIRVNETPQVSQPNPLGQGETAVVPRTEVDIEDDAGKKFALLKPGVNLQDLVDGLNALGIGPRDMIAILQALKVSGALHAEIEVM